MKSFDLIVIGSGAGLGLANDAARNGWRVALIEKGALGGTCLNRGCIPSKIVIHSADVAEGIRKSSIFGVDSKVTGVKFKKVTDRANKLVDGDSKGIEKALLSRRNPTLFQGEAKFVGKYDVEVNGKIISGKRIVIAAGARPFIPPIDGLDNVDYMTSTEALRQTKLPKSMIVIGGGYIGSELGHFYAALGCKITIVQRNALLLPREDREVAELFTALWRKRYDVLTKADVVNVAKRGKGVEVTVKQNGRRKKLRAEKLLVATGVRPNTGYLNVAKAGVKMDKRGFIRVNQFMETNVKDIWALGDIAGVYMFRHSANLERDFVQYNLFHKKQPVDYFPMPHAVFTTPQIAGVGKTEQELKGKGYVVGKALYKNTGMGEALAEEDGFVKLLVDPRSRKILGCHVIGPHASVLLHEVLIAMKAGKDGLRLLRNVVHIHPALSEVVQRAAMNVPV